MKFNKIYKATITAACVASLGLMGTSCIDYEDNVNSNEVTDDMMAADNLRTGAFFQQMLRNVIVVADGNHLDSDYQVAQNLIHDIYSGYATSTLSSDGRAHQYIWVEQWNRAMYNFSYTGAMSPWKQIHEVAAANDQAEVSALADIVKVLAMHRVADSYGPINYVSYGESGTFDPLQDIYAQFFKELDNSIEVLTTYANTGAKLLSEYDIVYQGNVTNWVKLANTLRLRLALRVAYADDNLARTEAEKSINHPLGFVDSKANRAKLGNYYHPIYTIHFEFGGSDGDTAPGASIVSYMANMGDPRISKYFTTATEDGQYHGVRPGYQTDNVAKYRDHSKLSRFNMPAKDGNAAPVILMTGAESFFLRAEAALRWNLGGDPASLYAQGVQTSFDELEAGSADNYLMSEATPGRFEDTVGSDHYNFKSSTTPKWNDGDSFEGKLERIITQKWIAIYPDGCEGWTEFRRTGYPALLPVTNNKSNGTIDTDLQVRRVPFPDTEYTNNLDGVQAGIRALGGPDNGGTKLWWDQKPR